MSISDAIHTPLVPPRPEPRVDILGVHVSVTNHTRTMDRLASWVSRRERQYVCVCDVNSLLAASADPELRAFYNNSGLTLPDGMPLVWGGKYAGYREIERVSGPDLFPRVLTESSAPGWRHFFLGGSEGVAERLAARCRRDFPGIQIVGTSCPPFRDLTEDEKNHLVDTINAAQPDIVWIGLGAPKQERWMADFRPRLEAPVLVGIGAAFNFQVGDVNRAPEWMQRGGLEWFYRLTQEPQRLWRRYLFGLPRFGVGVVRNPPTACLTPQAQ